MPDFGDLLRQEKVGSVSACYIIINSFLRGTMCRMMMSVPAESNLVICSLEWERRRCGREARCIGCDAGFAGDRPNATLRLLLQVPDMHYLVLECLVDRTLSTRYEAMVGGGYGILFAWCLYHTLVRRSPTSVKKSPTCIRKPHTLVTGSLT